MCCNACRTLVRRVIDIIEPRMTESAAITLAARLLALRPGLAEQFEAAARLGTSNDDMVPIIRELVTG